MGWLVDLMNALGGWGVPVTLVAVIGVLILILQLIGLFIEISGKSAPALLSLIKYFKKRKQAKIDKEKRDEEIDKTLIEVKQQQAEVKTLLTEVNMHYSKDNITQRNCWMRDVNESMDFVKERAQVYDSALDRLLSLEGNVIETINTLKQNNAMTSQMYKDINRNRILDFAHGLANARKADKPVIYSREEFRKIHRVYEDYEEFLATYGGTNGEVDDAMRIVRKAEAGELPNIEFLEDMRD